MDSKKITSRKSYGDYFIGLDIGTNSVGWAVTDENYRVLKFNGKHMWGSRLFGDAQTAEDRRLHRNNRRRLQRRNYRLSLLEEIFAEELGKIDKTFLIRLKESKYHMEDKSFSEKFLIFNDKDYNDKDFFKKYPTIYHLRAALIRGEKEDLRAYYMAIKHIVKYRGHFLIPGKNISVGASIFEGLKTVFLNSNIDLGGYEIYDDLYNFIEEVLLDNEKSKSDKNKTIKDKFKEIKKGLDKTSNHLNDNAIKQVEAIIKLSLGLTANIKDLYNNEEYTDLEDDVKKINLSDTNFDENEQKYMDLLGDRYSLIEEGKKIFDAITLSKVKFDGMNLSESKVAIYNKHRDDLLKLKKLLREYDEMHGYISKDKAKRIGSDTFIKDSFDKKTGKRISNKELARKSLTHRVLKADIDNGKNYLNYIGASINSRKRASQEDFYKFLKKELQDIDDSEEKEEILNDIELENFLPLQRTKLNGAIPYQLQLTELRHILDNAENYFPFLKENRDGITERDKIESLMKFRVPYYVGPLNSYHNVDKGNGFAWIVKKKNEKIYPWNFEDVVDVEASAEKFIENLTNKCTYLRGEDVLAKNSLLYSEFMLINELNNIKINGERISIEVRNIIIEELFEENKKKVTPNAIRSCLKRHGLADKETTISGIDIEVKSDIRSYRDMVDIFGKDLDKKMCEDLILWITIFGESKNLLKNKINSVYGNNIENSQMKKLLRLKYRDWGRLSKKFLTELFDDTLTGQKLNIINTLRDYPMNMMELLSTNFGYLKEIDRINGKLANDDKLSYDILEDVFVSPAVKRGLWQTIKIMEEIIKIMGRKPSKIFVETTRSNSFIKGDKGRTSSRFDSLSAIYRNIKTEGMIRDLSNELKNNSGDLSSKKLFLYFTQNGRCMYTGEVISLEDLGSSAYDIDHIYPRSKTKDNSFDNLVLVKAEKNRSKSDSNLVGENTIKRMERFWYSLKKLKLISDKKYERLTRRTELTDEELARFIARQVVETSQTTKAAAILFSRIYPETRICYVKAENISDFRQARNRQDKKYGEYIKLRDLNDHHHAKDAYLNIVVGNVYDEKFTKNPLNFIKNLKKSRDDSRDPDQKTYSLNKMFDFNVVRNSKVAWDKNKSMKIVDKMMKNNDVQVTKMTTDQKGALYDATIYGAKLAGKGKEGAYLPLKMSDDKLLDTSKYGGYTKIKNSYYSVYEYEFEGVKGRRKVRRIVPIPIYISNSNDDKELFNYLKDYDKPKKGEDLISLRLIYKKLNIGSKVLFNEIPHYLGGKTNEKILADSAVQIIFPDEYVAKFKKISNYINKKKEDRNLDIDRYIIGMDKENNYIFINDEMLNDMFEFLLEKSKKTYLLHIKTNIVHVFDKKISEEDVRNKFFSLDKHDKCVTLMDILNTLTCKKSTYTMDQIGVKISRGYINNEITKLDSFKVINDSITGLYTNEIELLEG